MTATNMMADANGFVLWSDTALYNFDAGRIVGFTSKQRVNVADRWAITASGPEPIYALLDRAIESDLDEAHAQMPGLLRTAVEAFAVSDGYRTFPHAGLYYGGYSKALGRFVAYAIRSASGSVIGPAGAYEPVECNFLTAPQVFVDGREVTFTLEAVNKAVTELGILEFCKRTMQNQRSGLGRDAPENGVRFSPVIGGKCECTLISMDGVRTMVLDEWSDGLGDTLATLKRASSISFGSPMPEFAAQSLIRPSSRTRRRRTYTPNHS